MTPVKGTLLVIILIILLGSFIGIITGIKGLILYIPVLVLIYFVGLYSGKKRFIEIGWRRRRGVSPFGLSGDFAVVGGPGYWGNPETRLNIGIISSIILVILFIGLLMIANNVFIQYLSPLLDQNLIFLGIELVILVLVFLIGDARGEMSYRQQFS